MNTNDPISVGNASPQQGMPAGIGGKTQKTSSPADHPSIPNEVTTSPSVPTAKTTEAFQTYYKELRTNLESKDYAPLTGRAKILDNIGNFFAKIGRAINVISRPIEHLGKGIAVKDGERWTADDMVQAQLTLNALKVNKPNSNAFVEVGVRKDKIASLSNEIQKQRVQLKKEAKASEAAAKSEAKALREKLNGGEVDIELIGAASSSANEKLMQAKSKMDEVLKEIVFGKDSKLTPSEEDIISELDNLHLYFHKFLDDEVGTDDKEKVQSYLAAAKEMISALLDVEGAHDPEAKQQLFSDFSIPDEIGKNDADDGKFFDMLKVRGWKIDESLVQNYIEMPPADNPADLQSEAGQEKQATEKLMDEALDVLDSYIPNDVSVDREPYDKLYDMLKELRSLQTTHDNLTTSLSNDPANEEFKTAFSEVTEKLRAQRKQVEEAIRPQIQHSVGNEDDLIQSAHDMMKQLESEYPDIKSWSEAASEPEGLTTAQFQAVIDYAYCQALIESKK